MGVQGEITSPTFVIARVHRPDPARGGRVPLVHVDAYRLGGPLIRAPNWTTSTWTRSIEDSVVVVEWGEGVAEQLADAHLRVRIDRRDDDSRRVELLPHGGDWEERLAALR